VPLLATAALCLAAAIYLVVRAPRRAVRASVARATAYGRVTAAAGERRRGARPGARALARVALLLAPRLSRHAASTQLHAAGLGIRLHTETYLAGKTVVAGIGVVAGLATGGAAGRPGVGIILALLLGAAGFLAPGAVLEAKARRRRDEILASFPNALDLLAVSVDAGLGLDGAIARYAQSARGPLAQELARVVAELRVGAARREVLQRLSERVQAREVTAFVRAVVHADQLGISVTHTLRTQAAEARKRRHALAEEVANKAPVKMLFPTVFFVFPALFVVVLGPAVISLTHAFQ
jgi:tight adherence protein C